MNSERRKHRRVPINCKITISYRAGDSIVTDAVQSKDLSIGGAKVSGTNPYPLASIIQMKIHLPNRVASALGAICYVEEKEGGQTFDVGIRFIGLGAEEARKLEEIISQIKETTS